MILLKLLIPKCKKKPVHFSKQYFFKNDFYIKLLKNKMNNDVLMNISRFIPYYWDKLLLSTNKYLYLYHQKNIDIVFEECFTVCKDQYTETLHGMYIVYYTYAENVKFVLGNHKKLIPNPNLILKAPHKIDRFFPTNTQDYRIADYFKCLTTDNFYTNQRMILVLLSKFLNKKYGWILKTATTSDFTEGTLRHADILYITVKK